MYTILLKYLKNVATELVARMLKLFTTLSSVLKYSTYYFHGSTKLFSDLYLVKF